MGLIIGSLGAEHKFYDGTEILRFDEPAWKWYRKVGDRDYEPLFGVTKIVKIIDKSEVLMNWAKKKSMEKLRRLMLEGYLGPDQCLQLFVEELDKIIAEAKRADKEILEAAADTGHAAHQWIESYVKSILLRDRDVPPFPKDPRAAKCCLAMLSWEKAHNVRWVSTERKVYSRKYRFAGTLDGLAYVDSCQDPHCCKHKFVDQLSVIDWKSSNYLYLEYLLQTAAYWQALFEETGQDIKARWIVRLGKDDGEFDPWYAEGQELFEEDFGAFKHALGLTQSIERIDARISVIKDERRAFQKEADRKLKEAQDRIACPKSKDYKGSRRSKCLPDGTQCISCKQKYESKHPEEV